MIDKARPTLVSETALAKGMSGTIPRIRSGPKIAIVHEWLTTYAGSEKVLEAMLDEFPDADLFCLIDFLTPEDRAKLNNRYPKTTFLQKLPMVRKFYPFFLALMPFAVEQHDLSGYDVVVSNSHAVAKGVIVGPDQLHICYCYSPMRYAWDLQNQYLLESGMNAGIRSLLSRMVLHYVRLWDVRTAPSVDRFIACSAYIARRVRRAYRRDADVIYPNVAVEQFTPGGTRGDFYLASSRLTPYKRVLLIVEAFALMPGRKLVVIGAGPQYDRIKKAATPNVTVLGYQEFPVLLAHMQAAKAFVFAAEEDFGIAPLEAQACGTPVLAFSRGGASETVVDGITGLHFHTQDSAAICDAVERFEAREEPFDPHAIRCHAQQFSTQRFRREFRDYVQDAWAEHRAAEEGRAIGRAKGALAQAF
ncbi:glycosyltransferase [Lichenihabitans sp. Uapishka_5]|uniref:glycosyltransferase n=1 Tax=Lichenihabitans sp. Uapishka_5 TaxID=3037302 RepID=UPI0029E7E700|nr:glycosyltransferase [Lichenihabitans sp. Uapishka_5]MDX7950251.1 glycosyltransferase [Lichenihabitans sp. Uapishka_5]